MAINSQKLLPSSKVKATTVKENKSSLMNELIGIKIKTLKIESILKKTFLLQNKNEKIKIKEKRNIRFLDRENILEKKDKKQFKINKSIIPQFGIFDNINRFITFTFIGWLVNNIFKYIPQILEFTKKIEPVVNFIETFAGNVFNGMVDFIDFGYDAYDKVRDFTKTLGGESFQKTFDDFSKNLNTFVNLAIIAGMATMGGTDFGRRGGPDGGRRGNGVGISGRSAGRTRNIASASARRYAERFGRDAAIKKFGKEGVESLGGKYARSGLTRFGRNALVGTLGKSGAKQAFKILKPLMGRIPIIGGLIEFGLSWALGDPVGKAAFRGIGAVLVGAIGTAVGGPIGAALGSWAGGEAGGALYDVIFGNKKKVNGPKKPEIKANAKGGKVTTRKGKVVGGAIKRTVRRTITSPKPSPIDPGKSIGGENIIKKMLPEPTGSQVGKSMNPYGFVVGTANMMSEIPFLGPIFSLFGKTLLGDLPNKTDYKNIGLGINAWINNAISKGYLQGNLMKGFADGGVIDNDMMRDISGWVEKSVEELVKNKVTEAINNLRKNLGMEPLSGTEGTSGFGAGGTGEFSPTGIQKDIYEYLLSKGLDDNKSLGIMANINRESGFRVDARQPDGPGVGLFQYSSAGRKDAFLKSVPDWTTNWKGQVDYALKEDVGPQYFQMKFSSPEEAADWWMKKWERPREDIQNVSGPKKHKEYLESVPKSKEGKPSFPSGIQFGDQKGNLNLVKELGKSMGLNITSTYRPGDRGYHGSGRAIDFQTPGKPGNTGTPQQMNFAREIIKKYGSNIKELIYTPLGFGIKDGKQVPLSTWGPISPPWANLPDEHPLKNSTNAIHYDHVHVAFQGGGKIGEARNKSIKSIQTQAFYDDVDTVYLIQPVMIKEYIPIQTSGSSINFGSSGGVNNNKISNLFSR